MGEKFRLGEVLVAEGLISEHQLRAALGEQARWGGRIGATLVAMGFLPEADLVRTLTRILELPGIDLDGKQIEAETLALVPAEIAEKYRCLPLFCKGVQGAQVLYLGMDEPGDLSAVDEVSFRTGLQVRAVVVGPVQLQRALALYYRGETAHDDSRRDLAAHPGAPVAHAGAERPDLPVDEMPRESVFEAEAPEDLLPSPPLPRAASSSPPKQILQALVKLLIDKQVISRRELMEAVQSIDREAPGA